LEQDILASIDNHEDNIHVGRWVHSFSAHGSAQQLCAKQYRNHPVLGFSIPDLHDRSIFTLPSSAESSKITGKDK
jgi:hypothetical protein